MRSDAYNPIFKRTIKSKFGFHATYEDLGEHHMSASHVRIKLDRPFAGVISFHSTNGNAVFSDEEPILLVSDSCMLITLDYSTGAVKHCSPPKGCYFSEVQFVNTAIAASLYGSKCASISFGPIPLDSPLFKEGLGEAKDGFMPSAYVS